MDQPSCYNAVSFERIDKKYWQQIKIHRLCFGFIQNYHFCYMSDKYAHIFHTNVTICSCLVVITMSYLATFTYRPGMLGCWKVNLNCSSWYSNVSSSAKWNKKSFLEIFLPVILLYKIQELIPAKTNILKNTWSGHFLEPDFNFF